MAEPALSPDRQPDSQRDDTDLSALGTLLDRMEELLADVEALDEDLQSTVFELLDGVDAVHRLAITRLAAALGAAQLEAVRGSDPAVGWLFQAYGLGVDDRAAADAALEQIRPYIHEHGGEVEVLGVQGGVVRVRLSGTCSGCTSAADTLRHGVEEALREHLPGFVAMDVEPDTAAPHAPPTQVLLQITPRPA